MYSVYGSPYHVVLTQHTHTRTHRDSKSTYMTIRHMMWPITIVVHVEEDVVILIGGSYDFNYDDERCRHMSVLCMHAYVGKKQFEN